MFMRALGTVAAVTGNITATFRAGHRPAVLNWKPFLHPEAWLWTEVPFIVRPQVYRGYRQVIELEPLVVVKGKLQKRDGIANIVAERLMPLCQEGQCQRSLISPPGSESSDNPGTEMAVTLSAYRCRGHF